MEANSPPSKGFPTAIPVAGKGLFLGMGSLMSLDMFHAPNMTRQLFARQSFGLLLPGFPILIGSARGWRLD
ncbi:hypothetical protein QBC43DRAFT_320602 [Cladorrhinum sp. PSN259]|nr:hypothetical protein QBC43DRAFT_320602 [Cladorrhinum sp. PSN259]